ncbi:hypothetical protein BJQ94_13980 [Cryobacterium sp. SO2]|uniref:hypothetical protein n=1 Tax=Cryobacterium sp. SO2 TaxID=1897060 RepID=UPI00223CCE60|nr:hypothetical protein [Cryobacterium sp. SO2]WEO76466.1 hypothetical protein BJQ94_13980 [Cryobacterium sp. SO2]
MASWLQLKSYIGSNYQISADDGDLLKLLFSTGNGRSQMVLVSHSTTGTGVEFAIIASPVATVGTVELNSLLREVSEYSVGGVVIYGDMLMIRHSVPLADLDAGDFDAPLVLVTGAADAVEAKFVGSDAF